jgi:two-component system response regulator
MDDQSAQKKPITVLLVEDNPDHSLLITRGLEGHPMVSAVHHVSDGEKALEYLFRRGKYQDVELSPRPDLILLDLRLPRVSGLDVLEAIKFDQELRKVPVVVLTSSSGEPDIARAYELHANSYLVKPLDYAGFSKMLDLLGFYWLGWNKTPHS